MIGNISISSFCFAINMWNGIYINRISRFSSPTDKNQNTPPKSTIIIMIKIGKKNAEYVANVITPPPQSPPPQPTAAHS